MSDSVPLREIREGLARLLVPDLPRSKGPGTYVGEPFYNPTMERNRDMTVLLLRALNRPGISVFDGLSATGALGIRVAIEVPEARVTCNDQNLKAIELVRRNAELNGVSLNASLNERFQSHLAGGSYEFIDIDPFGTPVPYLDAAYQTAPTHGIVAVTATDTAVLCGAQQRTCIRRYGAKPLHIDCGKEIALRILIGYCARVAAKYDKAAMPLLSFSSDHYLRVFTRVEHGARKADEALSHIGYALYDEESGRRRISAEREEELDYAGPLWSGRMVEGDLVRRLGLLDYMRHPTSSLLDLLRMEVDAPSLYVTSEFLSRLTSSSPPPMRLLIETLKTRGFFASRTHFDSGGLKTDAPWTDLVSIYSNGIA